MNVCVQCQYGLGSSFYCCNPNQPVCLSCRHKPCKKCNKRRTIQKITPRCDKCRARLQQKDLLLQFSCDKYYCATCLSKLFKSQYYRVSVKKQFNQKSNQPMVLMYCGHWFPFSQLVGFFQHFCLCCGNQYYKILDYQLNDGVKLCSICYRSEKRFFQSVFIKCSICDQIIRNSTEASILQGTQTAICSKCTVESKVSQNLLQRSRKTIPKVNFIKPQQKYQLKQQKFQPKVDNYIEKKINQQTQNKIQQKKKTQQKIQIKQQQKISQQKSAKSPLIKLFKKPSISQLQKKQQKRANNDKQNSVSITRTFSNNFQDIDQQITQSLGLPQNVKLKKHLSNQTYVEQYPIQIKQNDIKNFVKCKQCCILVQLNIAYNIYDLPHKKNKSLSTISLSYGDSYSQINKQNTYYLCRICYFESSQRQKSVLQTTISANKSRQQLSNRPSKIQQNPSIMDHLKPGKSARKQMRSPSPSPNKQYHLTGSKQSSSYKDLKYQKLEQLVGNKPSLISPHQSPYKNLNIQSKHISRQKASHPHSIPQRFMRCQMCRDIKKSLIATKYLGNICDQCYYSKNPQASFKNR